MADEFTDLVMLAKNATKGKWIAVGDWVENERDDLPDVCVTGLSNYPYPERPLRENDAKYIAAAQPKAVLAMIAEIRRLRKELKK